MGGYGMSYSDFTSLKAIAFDGFNQTITGDKTMTLTGQRMDHKNIPTVFTLKIRGGAKWTV